MLWIDFETRSRCDLRSKGVYNYAQDLSTEVLCMSYAFDDEDVVTWLPSQPFPEVVRRHTGQIRAHNATFERLIFDYVLQIPFKLEQFYCTATQARANCAPGGLEDVGRFASSQMKKDHRGAQLIRLLSIPQLNGTFREDSALMAEMVSYCEQDVRAMRAVSKAMRDLSEIELADYHVNERINDRGVLIDLELCDAAMLYASAELLEIQTLVEELTEGAIKSVRSPKMREWVLARVGDEAKNLMVVHKDGEKKYSIDKTIRANLLALAEQDHDQIPPVVADVIQCADDLWASSVAKFSRLAGLADHEDHRVRGAFVFAGGAATGRACVASNTLVESEWGLTHISALDIGEKVLTHTGRLCKISRVIYKGREIMYRVSTKSGGWVECTGDHHLLTAEGWKNVKELIRNTKSRNTGRSYTGVYVAAVPHYGADGEDNRTNPRNSRRNRAGDSAARAVEDIESGELLQIQDGRKEPYAWCAQRSGGDFTQGVPIPLGGRAGSVRTRASFGADGVDGVVGVATGVGSPPHRQQQNEQLTRQLGDCVEDWASKVTLSEITEIVCVGEKGVWDITVEGDASYVAQGIIHHNSSYGAQVHNFTRKCAAEPDSVRHAMVRGHQIVPKYGKRVTDVLKGMLRPALVAAPGNVLVVADWSAIEGRVHPWLANTKEGEAKLDVFRSNLDPYKVNAAATFRVPYGEVTGEQRQVGKVQELALGFLGGAGAFEAFGRAYNVRMTDGEIKRAVDGWRRANPWAVDHGQRLEQAYTKAVRNPSYEFSAGRVTYLFDGQHLWYALPSGRVLCYPYAKLESDGLSYAKAAFKPAADATEWPRARLWRGLACENITQAAANDILRYALRELDARELDVVLHVHDEIVVECAESQADMVVATMKDIMCTAPEWAQGLPLDIEIGVMHRYGKK